MSSTRSNEEWLHDLRESGSAQENAITDLQSILLRAVLFFFNRNTDYFHGVARDDILQLAEDCAQDALIAVLNHLPDFRGDSKFTTWAYKFGINTALIASRRARWKDVSLNHLVSAADGTFSTRIIEAESTMAAPDQSALQSEVRHVIQDIFEHDLTDKQRRVLILMVLHEVPMDVVVEDLNTNRNAIYKLLHDARRKLKSGLQARGFEVSEMLALFSSQR
jgi:RNA polymerase sigma-70 factor (ECF subfamily)